MSVLSVTPLKLRPSYPSTPLTPSTPSKVVIPTVVTGITDTQSAFTQLSSIAQESTASSCKPLGTLSVSAYRPSFMDVASKARAEGKRVVYVFQDLSGRVSQKTKEQAMPRIHAQLSRNETASNAVLSLVGKVENQATALGQSDKAAVVKLILRDIVERDVKNEGSVLVTRYLKSVDASERLDRIRAINEILREVKLPLLSEVVSLDDDVDMIDGRVPSRRGLGSSVERRAVSFSPSVRIAGSESKLPLTDLSSVSRQLSFGDDDVAEPAPVKSAMKKTRDASSQASVPMPLVAELKVPQPSARKNLGGLFEKAAKLEQDVVRLTSENEKLKRDLEVVARPKVLSSDSVAKASVQPKEDVEKLKQDLDHATAQFQRLRTRYEAQKARLAEKETATSDIQSGSSKDVSVLRAQLKKQAQQIKQLKQLIQAYADQNKAQKDQLKPQTPERVLSEIAAPLLEAFKASSSVVVGDVSTQQDDVSDPRAVLSPIFKQVTQQWLAEQQQTPV